MAQLGNLIVTGVDKMLSKLYVSDSVTAPTFIGKLQGNADTATKVNGHTVNSDVPANAKFTDTNTWRGVQDNLTSTATDQSLSANQGKVLKGLVDGKAASNHNHDGTYRKITYGNMDGDGKTSYCQVCTIKITTNYVNTPIEITARERCRPQLSRVSILFGSVDSVDPGLSSFSVFGAHSNWWISKTATSTWVVYAQKGEAWAGINILDYTAIGGFTITWNMTGVSSLPSSKTQASYGGYVYSANVVNGHTVNSDVPSGAKFTDTNTWRGIQNNLTSDSTSDSLSAAQGKVLKGLVDGKAASNHSHTTVGNSTKGTTTSDATGAIVNASAISGNTGIYNGNGDAGGENGTANLIIKSWYGVGFVDGCTGKGMTVGINCRTGNVKCSTINGYTPAGIQVGTSVPTSLANNVLYCVVE